MHRLSVAVLFLLSATNAVAQTRPASDSIAVSLAQQSIAALTNGTPISDATLTGNATWIAGSDNETGTVTLSVKGIAESRIDLSLSGGARTDIRNDTAGYPQGESIQTDATVKPSALHNCWINASWFFPALSFLTATTSDPNLIFSYVGLENHRGTTVQHLRIFRYLAGQHSGQISLVERISTMDVYLDSSSLFPRGFAFTTHPDDDAMTDIAAEIIFSNYQAVNGVQVPMHIRRLVQGGTAIDIVLSGATFNSGLPDSQFSVQ